MITKNKVFQCLNCGEDTGCSNKLVCDLCRNKNAKDIKLDYYSAIQTKKKIKKWKSHNDLKNKIKL